MVGGAWRKTPELNLRALITKALGLGHPINNNQMILLISIPLMKIELCRFLRQECLCES